MAGIPHDWTPDDALPTGKGGTLQRFETDEASDHLTIETRAWGSGDLAVNGEVAAHVDGERDGGEAFRHLERIAEKYEDVKAALSGGEAETERKS